LNIEFEFSLKPSDIEDFNDILFNFQGQTMIRDDDDFLDVIISNNNCYIECYSRGESEQTPCGSLAYIDELFVEPGYGNRKIGTEILKRMSQIIDMNRTMVALYAFPIVDDETSSH
jgi:hypothetical protein